MRQTAGFSLLEVTVTLSIFAIVVVLAMPSYQHVLVKVRRTEALTTLMNLSSTLERLYIKQGNYKDAKFSQLIRAKLLSTKYYHFSLSFPKDHQYMLKATPQNTQAMQDGSCGILSMDNTGKKTVSGTLDWRKCWNES